MSTDSVHIASKRSYFTIFALLMVCTYLTWQVAFFDLGVLNTVVALGIAVFKAVLVILFFMHVRHGARITWVVIVGAVFWLALILTITMSDYLTRGWK
jgi:cytochrome c oxidase subunit IV